MSGWGLLHGVWRNILLCFLLFLWWRSRWFITFDGSILFHAGVVGEQLVHLDASNAVNIKVFTQIFHDQGFHEKIARRITIVNTLHGGRNLSKNAEFLAAIVEPGTL